MPSLLVHLTLAKKAISHPDAPLSFVCASNQDDRAFFLGSIFPDLPYHQRIFSQIYRHLLKRKYLDSEWGDRFHHQRTGQFALALLLYHLQNPVPREKPNGVLALLAGYLSHYAVDSIAHPAINRQVQLLGQLVPRIPSVILHNRVELLQNIAFHYEQYGQNIIGTPLCRKMISKVAGTSILSPGLPRSLWKMIHFACQNTFCKVPSIQMIRDWMRGVTVYGHIMANPLVRMSHGRDGLQKIIDKAEWGETVDLQRPLDEAIIETIRVWKIASSLGNSNDQSEEIEKVFLQQIPDVNLATGQ